MANDAGRQLLDTLLVERGVITNDQLDAALSIQRREGGKLGEILTARGWVTPLSRRPDGPEIVPADLASAHLDAFEDAAGEIRLLKRAETFIEATDFVFDEVLWRREPGNLRIVRIDSGRREIVWSFRPADSDALEHEDMLSVLRYPVASFEDRHGFGTDRSVAA
jgi:hypothetical protein